MRMRHTGKPAAKTKEISPCAMYQQRQQRNSACPGPWMQAPQLNESSATREFAPAYKSRDQLIR